MAPSPVAVARPRLDARSRRLWRARRRADHRRQRRESRRDIQDQQTFKLTYNITFPPPAYEWEAKAIAVEDFAKLVEEKTNGRVKIDIYYSNQLVPQNEALEAMQSGTIDLLGSGPYWGDRVPTNDFSGYRIGAKAKILPSIC